MILLLIALNTAPIFHVKVPCWLVRSYIELYGVQAARAKGREKGYTDAEIDAVRSRCLK